MRPLMILCDACSDRPAHATLRQRVKRQSIRPVVGEGKGAWYRLGDLTG